jgi:hypothetical protein
MLLQAAKWRVAGLATIGLAGAGIDIELFLVNWH